MKATSHPLRALTNAKRHPLCNAIALSVAIAGTFVTGAHAQEASGSGQDAKSLDNLIVTGTRKVGMAVDDSPAPVQVITAEALQESGSPDLMNQLAFQVPSFNAAQQGTDMTSATLVASMRALSPNHTLVLVNGKRRHFTSNVAVLGTYAGAASADLSFIPTSAIASTEVLTDGAAAIYGSDAIAGVVNLITKKNANGGSLRTNVSGYDGGGGFTKNYQGNFAFGNDTSYFNLALESERRETINRHGSVYGPAACVADALASATGCPATNSGTTASGYPTSTGNTGLASAALIAAGYPTRFLADEYNMVDHPWYPYNQHQGDSPDIRRDIGFFSAGLYLNDTTELYFTGSYGIKDTVSTQSYRRPSQAGGQDLNGDGDRLDQVGGVWEVDVNPYALGFNPNIESYETDYEFGVGLTGELGAWKYDVSSNYGKNEMDVYTTNSANFSLWNLGAFAPEGYNYAQTDFYDGTFESSQFTVALDVSRDFDWGLALPVTFATGIEYREDTYAIGAGEPASYYGGGGQSFPGYNPLGAGKWERDNWAVYANLIFNPTENWLVDIAGRYEDYSDFGNKAVGKLTTRYDFSDKFAVRGTVSTGFRAPTMGESYYTAVQVGPAAANATIAAASVGSGLQPETSKNLSLGFVWKPLPNLTTTVDAYQIEIEGRTRLGTFAYSTSQSSSTLCGRTAGCTPNANLPDPANTDGVGGTDDTYNEILGRALVAGGFIGQWDDPTAPGGSFEANQRANISMSFFSNVLDTKTTGVDVVTTYNSEFDWARIDWILAANYNKTEVTKAGRAPGFESIPLFNDAAIWSIENNSPEWRVNLGATLHFNDKLSLIIRENIYGPQSTISNASAFLGYSQILDTLDLVTIDGTTYYKAEIGTLFTTNVELAYKPTKNLRLSVGADNLFDEYPDTTPAAIIQYNEERYSSTGSRNYLLGSPIGFFGTRWFAKVSYDW